MTEPFYVNNPDAVPVVCMECGWSGVGAELVAQACPCCDGRVREVNLEPEPDAAYERAASRDRADGFTRTNGKDWT